MARTKRTASSLALSLLALTACSQAPVAPPWMQTAAMARCAAAGVAPPVVPFRTDGCTLWPDRAWLACCVTHDMDYYCGGKPQLRARADERLQLCVAARSCGAVGRMAWIGARVGGAWLPWGWGGGSAGPR